MRRLRQFQKVLEPFSVLTNYSLLAKLAPTQNCLSNSFRVVGRISAEKEHRENSEEYRSVRLR
jgi:hypothetical protein